MSTNMRRNSPARSGNRRRVSQNSGTVVSRVSNDVKREFIESQQMVRRERSGRIAELVLRPVVRAGMEMTTGACLPAIAAGFHVPEKRFSQRDQRALIFHVFGQNWLAVESDPLERSWIPTRPPGWPQAI